MSLDGLAARGYVVDEWTKWQQGGCLEYAIALRLAHPELRFGVMVVDDNSDPDYPSHLEVHFFAHDDTHAYDSAGRHPLPYLGIEPFADRNELDADPSDYEAPDPQLVTDASDHIRRHYG